MGDELQDFGEYIEQWIERADALIDEKEAELDALLEKRNEAASKIGADSRGGTDEDQGDDEPRQGSLEEDEDEDT